MNNFRAVKLKARRNLHRVMQIPVYVFSKKRIIPLLTFVRIHREDTSLGGVKGTSAAFSERRDQTNEIIFDAEQYLGERGDFIVVSSQEAYRLDADRPIYNVTKTWGAAVLSGEQRANYKGPDECVYAVVVADLPGIEGNG